MRRDVVAHRGASGHRPEHTAAAYDLAFRLGADAIEADLVATRDGVLVCRHDLTLSRTTDVAARPEFRKHRTTIEIDGQAVTDWFVHDLTFDQISRLRARERWPRKRPVSASYDGQQAVLSLTQARELVQRQAERQGRPLGLFAELKHPRFFDHVGLPMADMADEHRGVELTWLSFDPVVLRQLHLRGHRQLIQIHDAKLGGRELTAVATYATGVAVPRKVVLPRETLLKASGFVGKATKRRLDVYVYSHRAENRHLPTALQIGTDPNAHGHGAKEAELLWSAGVRGIISDFPELAALARPALAEDSSRVS